MIKKWLERLPSRLPLTQQACTLVQTSCMQAEIDELRSENARLRVALGRAADDIESWGAYASSYFQEKWNLQADIYAARAALGES